MSDIETRLLRYFVRGFEVYRQPLMLALPSGHPLAQHEAISPAMLAREAFVNTTPEPDLGFFGYTEVIAGLGNFVPRVVKRDEDFMTVLAYVALDYGIAVVPETLKTMNLADVVFRDIAADPVPQTSVAFVYGSEPSPSAKLLIRHAASRGRQGRRAADLDPEAKGCAETGLFARSAMTLAFDRRRGRAAHASFG